MAPGLWIFLRKWLYFSWNGCHIHSNWPVIFFFKSNQGSKSFTRLMADLRQDINGGFAFSRCLNGTYPWRKCSVKALVHYTLSQMKMVWQSEKSSRFVCPLVNQFNICWTLWYFFFNILAHFKYTMKIGHFFLIHTF